MGESNRTCHECEEPLEMHLAARRKGKWYHKKCIKKISAPFAQIDRIIRSFGF